MKNRTIARTCSGDFPDFIRATMLGGIPFGDDKLVVGVAMAIV
jgi:hypothetical protein